MLGSKYQWHISMAKYQNTNQTSRDDKLFPMASQKDKKKLKGEGQWGGLRECAKLAGYFLLSYCKISTVSCLKFLSETDDTLLTVQLTLSVLYAHKYFTYLTKDSCNKLLLTNKNLLESCIQFFGQTNVYIKMQIQIQMQIQMQIQIHLFR